MQILLEWFVDIRVTFVSLKQCYVQTRLTTATMRAACLCVRAMSDGLDQMLAAATVMAMLCARTIAKLSGL